MRIIFIFLSSIVLINCSEKTKTQLQIIDFDIDYELFQSETQSTKTVFLTHGLRATKEYWYQFDLIQKLNDSGINVVAFSYPYFEETMMSDGGLAYRIQYSKHLKKLINIADAEFGTQQKRIIAGQSFGGLHALMGAAWVKEFDGYIAMISCTKINALTEFSELQTPEFDPFNVTELISKKKGLITWGTADDRIDYTLEIDLYNQLVDLGADVDSYEMPGVGHIINQNQIDLAVTFASGI